MSGLSTTGFDRKRLPELKTDLENAFRAAFPEINVAPDSVFGQIIGIVSNSNADIWEVMEAIYLSNYAQSAEGFSLDNVAQLTGVVRLPATKTQVKGLLLGDEGTIVPQGNQASVNETGSIFEQKEATTITKSDILRTTISVNTVTNSHLYTITIDAVGYDYNSDISATAAEIITGLVSVINTGPPAQDKVTATDNGDLTLTILVDDSETSFSVDVTAELTLDTIETPSDYEAVDTGPLVVVIGSLANIENPVVGFISIINLLDGATGTNTETDSALRIRRRQSFRITGAATVESIRARILQDVASVTAVTVIENRTNSPDGSGRPPHSFECIVSGGVAQDIGEKIWEVKPAGIETFGDEDIDVIDSQGDTQVMHFNRPTDKFAWIDVVITLNPEEEFPADGLDQISANLLAYGNTFEVGEDMIIQKFLTPIYAVEGIATAVVQIAITPTAGGPPAYGSINISIGEQEIALFADARIFVA